MDQRMRRLQIKIRRAGITRAVLLIGPYAIKFPRWRYGWKKFLYGLISNKTEGDFNCLADEKHLCPTLFSLRIGMMNVQRRCQPLTDDEWDSIDVRDVPQIGRAHV